MGCSMLNFGSRAASPVNFFTHLSACPSQFRLYDSSTFVRAESKQHVTSSYGACRSVSIADRLDTRRHRTSSNFLRPAADRKAYEEYRPYPRCHHWTCRRPYCTVCSDSWLIFVRRPFRSRNKMCRLLIQSWLTRNNRIGSSKLVILGGLAELFAGSISMGLGAYLAAITDQIHYKVEEARQRRQVIQNSEQEYEIMSKIFSEYGIGAEELRPVAEKLRSNPDAWVKVSDLSLLKYVCCSRFTLLQFMMDFELKLEARRASGPWWSALIMGLSYFLGKLPSCNFLSTLTVSRWLDSNDPILRRPTRQHCLVHLDWHHCCDVTGLRLYQSYRYWYQPSDGCIRCR